MRAPNLTHPPTVRPLHYRSRRVITPAHCRISPVRMIHPGTGNSACRRPAASPRSASSQPVPGQTTGILVAGPPQTCSRPTHHLEAAIPTRRARKATGVPQATNSRHPATRRNPTPAFPAAPFRAARPRALRGGGVRVKSGAKRNRRSRRPKGALDAHPGTATLSKTGRPWVPRCRRHVSQRDRRRGDGSISRGSRTPGPW